MGLSLRYVCFDENQLMFQCNDACTKDMCANINVDKHASQGRPLWNAKNKRKNKNPQQRFFMACFISIKV